MKDERPTQSRGRTVSPEIRTTRYDAPAGAEGRGAVAKRRVENWPLVIEYELLGHEAPYNPTVWYAWERKDELARHSLRGFFSSTQQGRADGPEEGFGSCILETFEQRGAREQTVTWGTQYYFTFFIPRSHQIPSPLSFFIEQHAHTRVGFISFPLHVPSHRVPLEEMDHTTAFYQKSHAFRRMREQQEMSPEQQREKPARDAHARSGQFIQEMTKAIRNRDQALRDLEAMTDLSSSSREELRGVIEDEFERLQTSLERMHAGQRRV